MRKNYLHKNCAVILSLALGFVSVFAGIGTYAVEAEEAVMVDASNFPDAGLRSYVSTHFDSDKDGMLSSEEIRDAREIDASKISQPINDLKGIGYFTNLGVYINNNEQSKVSTLSFSNFKKLYRVETNSGNVRSINLSGCEEMTSVSAENNANLDSLNVSGCNKLEGIYIKKSNLKKVDVRDAKNLTSISIKDSPQLSQVLFDVHNNLKQIDITETALADINLRNMPNLEELYLSDGKLISIDISRNLELKDLSLNRNLLSELDISNNKKLVCVLAFANQIQNFISGDNSALEMLELSRNELTSMDISRFTNLEHMNMHSNRIIAIDDSKNKNLRQLSFETDKLTVEVGRSGYFDLASIDPNVDMSRFDSWIYATPVPGTTLVKIADYDGLEKIYFNYNPFTPGLRPVLNCINIKRVNEPGIDLNQYNQPKSKRLFGRNRFETAFQIADEMKRVMKVDKFDNVIITYSNEFADALSGAYLSKVKNAPLLLVAENDTEETLAYIKNNLKSTGTVYILGGTGVIPKNIQDRLDKTYNTKRLSGRNRYETNIAILKEAKVNNEELMVSSGLDFADSLSASAAGKPILLVDRTLEPEQIAYLKSINTRKYTLIGGTGAVSIDVEQKLKSMGTTDRVFGLNRFKTSSAVARHFFTGKPKAVVLTYGLDFPDGLCGGVLAERMGAPLLLVTNSDTDEARAFAADKGIKVSITLGGAGIISDAAVKTIIK